MTGRKRKPLKKYKSRRKTGFARDVIRIITAFSFGLASSLYLYETGCTRAFSIWFGLTAGAMVFAGLELVSLVTARIFDREKSSVPLHVTLLVILILLLLFVIWYLLFMYEEPDPVPVVEEPIVQDEPVVPEQTQEEEEVLPAPPAMPEPEPEPIPEEPPVPAAPQFISVTRELVDVPDEPEEVSVEEPIEEETDPWEDDSFWDDWFVSGEDEIILEDGTVTMELRVNGLFAGHIDVIIEEGAQLLPTESVKALLAASLTEEAVARIFDPDVPEYMTPDDYLQRGVPTSVDLMASVVDMEFTIADMPWRTISIAGGKPKTTAIPKDAQEVRRALFMAKATFAPVLSVTKDRWNLSTNINTEFGIGYLKGRLSGWMTSGSDNPFAFGFNGLSASFDIPKDLLRVSFGTVQTGLISSYGRHVGIVAETSPAYASEGWKAPSSHHIEIMLEEPSVIEVTNEGKTIYKRKLQPGNYRLEDLVLTEGRNDIDVKVTPISGNEAPGTATIIKYSPSLLAKGETYWRAGTDLCFDDNQIGLPTKYILSGAVRSGVTKTFTLSADTAFAFRPDEKGKFEAKAVFDGTIATSGAPLSTSLSLNLKDSSDPKTLSMNLQASGKADTDIPFIKNIGWSLSWMGQNCWSSNTFSGKLNASGTLGIFGWSLSAGGSLTPARKDLSSVNASLRLTATPIKNLTLYLSASAYADMEGNSDFQCRVGGSWSMDKLSVYGDSEAGEGSTNISWNTDNLSLQSSWRGEWKDYTDPGLHRMALSGGVSVFGFPVNGSFSINGNGQGFTGNMSTTFSALFADGLFVVLPVVPERILMVRQDGALKGNALSVGTLNSTEMSSPAHLFGTYVTTGLPRTETALLLSSDPKDGIGTSSIQTVALPEEKWGTYIYKMDEQPTYTVTGMTTDGDDEPLGEGAFMLQTWQYDDGGELVLVPTERYLFTDSDGRFIADGLEPGSYAFETQDDGEWSLREFEVSADWDHKKCALLTETRNEGKEDYDVIYTYEYSGSVDMDRLFDILYGEVAL